jgi:TolA-binding protein
VYPDERVAQYMTENFIPVKLHIREQQPAFERFGAQWTPTAIILDNQGKEQHRFEGFLPVDDFLAELHLGLAKAAFGRGDFAAAEQRYREVVNQFPNTDVAPEALYWAGVSKYKGTGDAGALGATAEAFQTRYRDSSWAKKASVWRSPA